MEKKIKNEPNTRDASSGCCHSDLVERPRSLFTPDENTQLNKHNDTALCGLWVLSNCPVIAHRAGALWAPFLMRPAQSQEAKLAYDNVRCHNT